MFLPVYSIGIAFFRPYHIHSVWIFAIYMREKNNPRFPVKNLKEAVYAVFAFFDMFDYPLKIDEIVHYLSGFKADKREIKSLLESCGEIESIHDLYFLKGRRELINIRHKREVIVKKYLNKTRKYVPLLQLVPFLKMAAVCNNLAFNNPKPGSDIDLFIITDKDRIFTARTISTMLFHLFGVRRHGAKIPGRFCLSFYLSEDSLDLSGIYLEPFDIYMDYWTKSLKPIFGKDLYEKFLRKNDADFPDDRYNGVFIKPENRLFNALKAVQEFILKGRIGNFIEKRLEHLHIQRYEKNKAGLTDKSSVVVSEKMLKFHNIDRREEFNGRFLERYQKFTGL